MKTPLPNPPDVRGGFIREVFRLETVRLETTRPLMKEAVNTNLSLARGAHEIFRRGLRSPVQTNKCRKESVHMAKWKKDESFRRAVGRALAKEGGDIAKSVGKELLSIATLGFYTPRRRASQVTIRYPDGRIVRIRR